MIRHAVENHDIQDSKVVSKNICHTKEEKEGRKKKEGKTWANVVKTGLPRTSERKIKETKRKTKQ